MIKRVLLGIDFIGANFPAALYTIQQWWAYASQSRQHICLVGISNFCDRQTSLPGANNLTPADALKIFNAFIPEDQLLLWTSDIDAGLLEKIKKNGCHSQPFYPDFNYGSVVNRLLLLASSHNCDYLIRVDPGTLPPKDKTFEQVMDEHQQKIADDPSVVISRRYADRLALRDMFVSDAKKVAHIEYIKKCTGINVKAQITGGAMLTFKTPGIPAICFPTSPGLTLVWASDDGIYQILDKTKSNSKMLDDKSKQYRVQRFDAEGKPKTPKVYYRGILGAVYLKALQDKKDEKKAKIRAQSFLNHLTKEILAPQKCKNSDPEWKGTLLLDEIAPEEFFKAIRIGNENHDGLLLEWEKICAVLQASIVRETRALE